MDLSKKDITKFKIGARIGARTERDYGRSGETTFRTNIDVWI